MINYVTASLLNILREYYLDYVINNNRMSIIKECDGSAGRIVSERSDKCYETTRLGTPRCRRILGNHRPMETGMGTRSPGSGQSGLLTRTIRYSHAVCRSHQSSKRIQTVSTCIRVYLHVII